VEKPFESTITPSGTGKVGIYRHDTSWVQTIDINHYKFTTSQTADTLTIYNL
jgi:hypothetical protein